GFWPPICLKLSAAGLSRPGERSAQAALALRAHRRLRRRASQARSLTQMRHRFNAMRPLPIKITGEGPPAKKEAALGGAALTRFGSSDRTIHISRRRARAKCRVEDMT